MTLRAAVYCRTSSDAQRKDRTIDAQTRDVPAACRAQGWAVIEPFYIDDGKSAATGKLGKRDAFARLAVDAAAGMFDIIAVSDIDRLTRTTGQRERGAILGVFQDAGVRVFISSTGQLLDLDTDEGDMMGTFGVLGAAAENRRRRAKTMAGKETTILRGGKPRGSTPIGLLYTTPDNRRGIAPTWSVDPVWAIVIREIHERVARHESTCSIARDLARRDGVARPRGGAWTDNRVREIVTSETYTGRLVVHHATGRAVPVPPIVDLELAREARAVLTDRYRQPPARTRHPHLLAGLLRCGLCRARVGIHGYDTAAGPVHSYLCTSRRFARFGRATCALPRMPVADLDARAWAEVSALLATPEVVDRAYAGSQAPAVDAGALDAARLELARLDGLMADVLAQAADGLVSGAVADAQVRRLGTARKAAQCALRAAQATRAGIRPAMDRDALAEHVGLLARWCADPRTTAGQRRGMMAALVGAAVLSPGSLALDLQIPDTVLGAADSRSTGALSAGRLTLSTRRPRAA